MTAIRQLALFSDVVLLPRIRPRTRRRCPKRPLSPPLSPKIPHMQPRLKPSLLAREVAALFSRHSRTWATLLVERAGRRKRPTLAEREGLGQGNLFLRTAWAAASQVLTPRRQPYARV
jgi:hypothetical protein